jgi:chromosome segregation ATPase
MLPTVRLEVRTGKGRATLYEVGDGGFLIGGVIGCDLRLPGENLPPLSCLIHRNITGVSLRKLAPIQAITVNGRPISSTYLADGDRLTIERVEIICSIKAGAAAGLPPAPEPAKSSPPPLEWAVQEATTRELRKQLAEVRAELEHYRQRVRDGQAEQARLQEEIEILNNQQGEAQDLRRELTQARQDLVQRFQERRDRLAKQQMAIRRAALRIQKRKQKLDVDAARLAESQQEWALREAGLEAAREQLARERQLLEEQARKFVASQEARKAEWATRTQELKTREHRLAEEKTALDRSRLQHQADLVRLDRLQAVAEQRHKQLQARALEVDRAFEQLQRDSRDLEQQARQLDDWHSRIATESEQLARQKREQEALTAHLEQRAAALEGQQAMLAALRTRLERMREELRRQEHALSNQRAAQEAAEADLRERVDEVRRLREELDGDRQMQEHERLRLEERQATLDAAVAQLRASQEAFTAAEAALREQQEQFAATAAEQAEQGALLATRAAQLDQLRKRLEADREALRERETALSQSGEALAALQEQLRRRGEEFTERERHLDEKQHQLQQAEAALAERGRAAEAEQQQAAAQFEAIRQQLQDREKELEALTAALAQRDEANRAATEQLNSKAHSVQAEQEQLAQARLALESAAEEARAAAEQNRAEIAALRDEMRNLLQQVPELEARAAAAVDRLGRARERLREHLAELHAYVRQGRDDLEAARQQVRAEVEQVRQHELALQAARDEHRLAVAAFRQQLIDWQGQLNEMKQALQRGEIHLDRRQAEVNQQAQQIAVTSARLAEQAEQLQQQQRLVSERRGEVDRHLADMREWYRRKLRELAGVDLPENEPGPPSAATETAPAGTPERDILSLPGTIEPGDRKLGELLRSLDLVDADTLAALLLEARRQRRSLRQLLLAGNYLTLYQMALIEAGNLDGLMLGPVRVVDRLQATPHEAIYRVFDPRHNREVLLRHLAEAEMHDAVRPDEFRQRFAAAAAVQHLHVAATYEVLEINARPAVLQEWLMGLTSVDWPALAAAPGVWFRLVCQAALALQAVHAAGLVHGRLRPESFVFTGDGVLKLCGLGEPSWLAAPAQAEISESDPAADLSALGVVALSWAAGAQTRKGTKTKPLPEVLLAVLQRLQPGEAECIPSAAALLEELDRVSAEVPPNAAAWERFTRQVREQAVDTTLRRSA